MVTQSRVRIAHSTRNHSLARCRSLAHAGSNLVAVSRREVPVSQSEQLSSHKSLTLLLAKFREVMKTPPRCDALVAPPTKQTQTVSHMWPISARVCACRPCACARPSRAKVLSECTTVSSHCAVARSLSVLLQRFRAGWASCVRTFDSVCTLESVCYNTENTVPMPTAVSTCMLGLVPRGRWRTRRTS